MVTVGHLGIQPIVGWRRAGFLDRNAGSTKTRKISVRVSSQVREGSKVIVPLFDRACRLFALRVGDRERASGGFSGPRGFSFGEIFFSLVRASVAHSCGL